MAGEAAKYAVQIAQSYRDLDSRTELVPRWKRTADTLESIRIQLQLTDSGLPDERESMHKAAGDIALRCVEELESLRNTPEGEPVDGKRHERPR